MQRDFKIFLFAVSHPLPMAVAKKSLRVGEACRQPGRAIDRARGSFSEDRTCMHHQATTNGLKLWQRGVLLFFANGKH
jgi:hypothetical protein